MTDWWVGAGGALFGAIVGSFIPLGWSKRQRSIERRGETTAIHVELYQVSRILESLLADKIMAPLYRLPVSLTKREFYPNSLS